MLKTIKHRISNVIKTKTGIIFLILIYFACIYFWWNFDHLWERLWIGLLFLIFVVIGLNIFYLLLCYILFDNNKISLAVCLVLLFLFPISEFYTYHLAENPFDSYYIKDIKNVANIDLPRDINIISKRGERPDLNGHYHYTFTAKLSSSNYWALKRSLLQSNNFNDTTELLLTDGQKDFWKIDSNTLSQSLRILDAKGSLTVKLIDKENKIVFLYNDI